MEATSQDALLVFGKRLASRPAVIQRLLSLSKTYSIPLQSLQTSWSRLSSENCATDKENVFIKDTSIPSMNELEKLEETLARYE
jgi:hypothetical protein